MPQKTAAPSASRIVRQQAGYSGTYRLFVDGQQQPANLGSFNNLSLAQIQTALKVLFPNLVKNYKLENRNAALKAISSAGQVLAEVSKTATSGSGFSLG
jgi:hypothetical protein